MAPATKRRKTRNSSSSEPAEEETTAMAAGSSPPAAKRRSILEEKDALIVSLREEIATLREDQETYYSSKDSTLECEDIPEYVIACLNRFVQSWPCPLTGYSPNHVLYTADSVFQLRMPRNGLFKIMSWTIVPG